VCQVPDVYVWSACKEKNQEVRETGPSTLESHPPFRRVSSNKSVMLSDHCGDSKEPRAAARPTGMIHK